MVPRVYLTRRAGYVGDVRELALFSGGGGGLLASIILGHRPLAYVENDAYCGEVLKARMRDGVLPVAPIFGDVRNRKTVDLFASLSYADAELRKEIRMPANRKEYLDEAAKLYETGMSVGSIAHHYGVTRQAMWKALQRRGAQFRNQLRWGPQNHFFRGGVRAVKRVHDICDCAISAGILKRAGKCSSCGASGTMADGRSIIQAHHDDYNKALKVRWLCQRCHHEWHLKNKAIPFKEQTELSRRVDLISAGFP